MIDSHCHLDFSDFDHDRELVVERARSLGVSRILVPGVSAAHWQKQLEVCQTYPLLDFALGLHPYFLKHFQSSHLQLLQELLDKYRSQVIALGEIGLDFGLEAGHSQFVEPGLQEDVFIAQLEIATVYQLPIIIHHRKSHHKIMQCLKQLRFEFGGVIHAFSGSLQQASAYIDCGFKLGVGGTITYPRAEKTRDTLSKLPLDALLLETDAPDMPMQGKQGQRNSPENLPQVLAVLSELTGQKAEAIIEQTTKNYFELFLSA